MKHWCGYQTVRALLFVLFAGLTSCRQEQSSEEIRPVFKVETGVEPDAIMYYSIIQNRLHLDLLVAGSGGQDALNTNHKLADLLAYAGYAGLSVEELDKLEPAAINDPATFQSAFPDFPLQPGDLVAASFFAPKITDVSQTGAQRRLGFRKTIRIKVRGKSATIKSPAQENGISHIWILFNYFVAPADAHEPVVPKGSGNTQAMLIRENPVVAGYDPAYWLVYGPTADGAVLTNFLAATFDARFPTLVTDATANPQSTNIRKYFVPTACAVCHGGLPERPDRTVLPPYSTAKLNYLDTDHWHQRVNAADETQGGPGTDFPEIKQAGIDPLLHTDFAAFITLNGEIRDQNKAVDGKGEASHQLLAAQTWMDEHGGGKKVSSPFERSVVRKRTLADGTEAKIQWSGSDPVDQKLLPLLDRYCYRCHSSVIYNVYDKQEVTRRRNSIRSRLNLPLISPTPGNPDPNQTRMPQDRELAPDVKERIRELVGQLPALPN